MTWQFQNKLSSNSNSSFKGNFSFQGASSQIPPLVLNPKPGDKVLDMAASPGSKTTQIATLMCNEGQLVVNDSNIKRMQAFSVVFAPIEQQDKL